MTRFHTDKYALARKARELKRLENVNCDYPKCRPELRKKIIIIDYDLDEKVIVFDCYKTNRIDCFKVYVDGKLWKKRAGWSKITEGIRKSFVRILSTRRL